MNDVKRAELYGGDAEGVVQSWIDGGLDTAQAVLQGWVDIFDQSRLQIHERVAQTLDWAEGFPKGLFAVARHVNRSVDAIAAQSISASDRVGRSLLSALRHAGHSARGLASDATTSLVGNASAQRASAPS